jgi:hypothetical protein
MGFLRRLLGGGAPSDAAPAAPNPATETIDGADAPPPPDPARPVDLDAAERAYELDVLREEGARLDDLTQRQLKYARYSWQPPRQGGDRRADDADETP